MAQKAILAVEDDTAFAAYLETALTHLGYDVLAPASTGEDAIERTKATHPDLILMGIELPGRMDGIAAAKQIQSFTDVPIVYLTGRSEAPFTDEAAFTAPYGYLVKPVRRQELAATIETALHRHTLDMKLKASGERLKLALSSSRVGVWEWDKAAGHASWSPRCGEIFGTTDLGGTFDSFVSFIHPADVPRVLAAMGRVSVGRPWFRKEFRIIRPDGEVRWISSPGRGFFDAGGKLLRVTGTVQDITKRKRAEEGLRRSEQRMRSLFETSKDAILLVNQETYRIVSANPAACRLYGYSPEELLQLKITELSAEPEKAEACVAYSITDIPVCCNRKKDGTIFPVEISGSFFVEGGVRLHTAIIRDVTERTRVEERLRENSLQLEEAADLARIAYWEHDAATGEFIFNDALYELYGTTAEKEGGYRMAREEYCGRFVHPDDVEDLLAQIRKNMAAPRSDDHVQYEHRIVRPDGEVLHILSRNRIVTDREGRIVKLVGVNQDITARKKASEALRESERKYRDLFETVRDGFVSVGKDKKIMETNPAFQAMVGYTGEELKGMTNEDLTPEKWHDLQKNMFEGQVMTRGYSDLWVKEYTRKNGTSFPVEIRTHLMTDAKGSPAGMWAFVRDVTERVKAGDALKESETKLRAILDRSRDAIGVAKDGIHTFVNSAYVSLFGYESPDELIGTPTIDLFEPESQALVLKIRQKNLAGEPVSPFYELSALKKDGTPFLIESGVSEYVLKGERHTLVILRDISEKKRLEAQLRQAHKMEAVGTLAGGIAHDFNNILSVIMGLGNLIQVTVENDDVLKPHVDQIVAASERAADLVQSLLAFSRKQRITLEPKTVNGVVESTAKLLTRLLPEDINVETLLTREDTSCLLDTTQIGQVLMNLVTNARDATTRGGTITIGTERVLLDERFKRAHGFGGPGEYVKFSVSDTGIGMDKETLKHIFEPFFTTKEVGKGTGLGLASAYGIVKQHQGYIIASSQPGKGTTFDVYLPFFVSPSPQKTSAASTACRGVETVLIVEDDNEVRRILASILQSGGYRTLEAADGEEAIELHAEHTGQIDLLVLDLVMPGKNGREALEAIRRSAPGMKAIFVSGYTEDMVIDRGFQGESVEFLRKPVSVKALLDKAREVLDRREEQRV